ncbi:uncharacterized protein A1O9_07186 [Exophiala aquamarina CBS 119918]|uniref:Enoyl reductase (ER) domain-containing protein n=1 Tax=Exophiala aquamarina CBS 119918 TaxID=1182545 RepID=A0A072PAU4_9EURO|nr:uncharacterized protein A1O9_07186 [Exophiala aquamarina CBS 119918]KEF56996.1 hypothetical protein A1O9_07186 [Exophiala aquamarina CBS 119918]
MIETYVMRGVDGVVTRKSAEVPKLKVKEVLVRITHTGLCGTDLFYIPFGCALGHEGIGIVEEVGSAVTLHNVGDRVGGGYLRSSCGSCTYCLTGRDILCHSRDCYGMASFSNGTFGTYYVGTESYVYPVPESISSEFAAPLQCAGATVYSALKTYYRPGLRVGVLGIGGLGHLAIQFASKMGAETVVFSTSPSKEEEAREFGASEFVVLGQEDQLAKAVDVLLITAHKSPDWNMYTQQSHTPRSKNTNFLTTLSFQPLFFNCYNIVTNLVASRATHAEMLNFAAAHKIKPVIEEFKLDEAGVADALGKLKAGKLRYRAVLHV